MFRKYHSFSSENIHFYSHNVVVYCLCICMSMLCFFLFTFQHPSSRYTAEADVIELHQEKDDDDDIIEEVKVINNKGENLSRYLCIELHHMHSALGLVIEQPVSCIEHHHALNLCADRAFVVSCFRYEKTCFLHMQKQRSRLAAQ